MEAFNGVSEIFSHKPQSIKDFAFIFLHAIVINLALEGKGEFTFRHLEILASCSFMLCQSSINQLDLPLPLLDGKHFVSFENKDDLLEKINYYLKNKNLRYEIALNGRRVLEEYYSPKKHGNYLINKIFSYN